MEPLAHGKKLASRYTLEKSLHVSKHGEVWLAQDDALKSVVVLKTARNDDVTGVNLLKNEHQMCSRCIHAGVVRTFELHQDNAHTYLSLEYLPGGSMLALQGRPQAQFLNPMIQIAEALQHVHDNHIIHRDVKLANILVDGRGHSRLIDFGIASTRGEGGLRSGGSARSMSPQQAAGEWPQVSDDLYAFGVALYSLLENKWPHPQDLQFSNSGELQNLISQLLHPDPAHRPADMTEVVGRLRSALSDQSNATLPPDEFVFALDDESAIEVVSLADPSEAALSDSEVATPQTSIRRGGLRKAVPWLLLYGVIGGAALFYLIPRWTNNSVSNPGPETAQEIASTESPTAVPSPAQVTSEAPSSEPWKLAQQAKLRKDAEATLETLLTKQFYLEDKQVALWAPVEFEKLKKHAIDGDQKFRQNLYTEALSYYEQGVEIADTLSTRAKTILEDTLSEANEALAAANSTLAAEKFALAKKINPRSQAALGGAQRAANLDEVLSLVSEAEGLEQSGQSSAALKLYRQAANLDGAWQAAQKGIQRITQQQARNAFARHMSSGHQALEAGDYAEAHNAFEQAKRIRPTSSEVTEAFSQLETAIRLRDVSNLRSKAQELERAGDLRGAEQQYQQVVARDGTQQTSRDDVRRVRARAEVDEQLTQLLNDPVSLSDDRVYQQAQDLITRAQTYMSDSSVASRVASLSQVMQQARVPVSVDFISDGQTEVLLYRVGRLGSFTNESRELRPGKYTAVGTRSGYRDVRVNFTLSPGQRQARVEIICGEAI